MRAATRIIIISLIVVSVLATVIAPIAVAQQANNSTSTSTPAATSTPTATPAAEGSGSEETILVEIDPHTRVLEAEWEDGEVTMIVERDEDARPTRDQLVVTDGSIDLQSVEAREIPQSRQRIGPGRHEISFSVENPSRAAVTVGTSRGLAALSPGDGGGWWSRSATWFDVRLAAIAALIGVPGVGLGLWHRVSSRSVDVEGVDLSEGNDE